MIEPPAHQATYYSERSPALDFHYRQGRLWLDVSAEGRHTTPLAYAAFEFRLGMERVALELLVRIGGTADAKRLLKSSRSFTSLKKTIYQLGGRQAELDRNIEFMNGVLRLAGAQFELAKVNIATLSKLWEKCSEFCHVHFTLALASNNPEFRASAYTVLQEADAFLREISNSLIGWVQPQEPWFLELQKSYVAGEIGEPEVTAKLQETGIWGLYTAPDGTKTFASDLHLRQCPPDAASLEGEGTREGS